MLMQALIQLVIGLILIFAEKFIKRWFDKKYKK